MRNGAINAPAHADQVLAGRLGPHGARTHAQTGQNNLRMTLEQIQPYVILLQHTNIERNPAVRRFQAGQVDAGSLGVNGFGSIERPPGRPPGASGW